MTELPSEIKGVKLAKFEVLTTWLTKIQFFWDTTPWRLVHTGLL